MSPRGRAHNAALHGTGMRRRTLWHDRPVLTVVLLVFTVEFAVMLLLSPLEMFLPPLGPFVVATFDATVLTLGILPFVLWIERRRRAAERAERHLAAVVEHAHDAIVGSSLDGRIVSWNPGAERMTGYGASEAIGGPVTLAVAPEYRRELPLLMEQINAGRAVPRWEAVGLCKDGTRYDAVLSIAPIVNRSGVVIGASMVARDITEQNTLVRELRQALAEVRTLSGLLPICASCKKVRDDTGCWHQIEQYVRDHTNAEFSHGVCSDCGPRLYGNLWEA